MEEYKNLKVVRYIPGAQVDCVLSRPVPCTNEYFVNAFWMPIKRQIGKKLVFSLQPDMRTFSLIYNQAALGVDDDFISAKQIKLIKEDSSKVFEVAMHHIDRIMEHFYCKEQTDDIIPFIDELRPIISIDDNTITLNGRLPMQESYFIKKYWNDIADRHQKLNKGIRYKIYFSELGTKISVTAELCRYNAICAKKGLPKHDSKEASQQVQIVICDLAETIEEAAFQYAESCRHTVKR